MADPKRPLAENAQKKEQIAGGRILNRTQQHARGIRPAPAPTPR